MSPKAPTFGEQRERYADAAALQKYCGIAPVTERSGNACWVHWRYQCPKFLRQTFVEWRLDPEVFLGARLLLGAREPEQHISQCGRAWPGLQMDTNCLPMLADRCTVRRIAVS